MADFIQQNVDLSTLNTMALPATAAYYCAIEADSQICAALDFATQHALDVFILGGGSNVIFDNDFNGLVLHMCTQGITLIEADADTVAVKVAAGEDWDGLLQYCLQQGWYGLENLAIIPGTVGAAPVQNIGAYGQEAADCIARVHCIDKATQAAVVIAKQDCHFAYRDSIFKRQQAGRYIITAVEFEFHKQAQLNISYAPLAERFADEIATAESVREAVITIRQAKLPSPKQLANSGSFFKNPVISEQQFSRLKLEYPDMPAFFVGDSVKLAAGWLIEQCGWKGRDLGGCGMYEKQALVMVNHGAASVTDIRYLREQVQADVEDKFQVLLEQEPVLVSG